MTQPLAALPPTSAPLEFTGERFDPSLAGEIFQEHLHRYLFALQFCAGKDVIDIASGEGYGTYILSGVARSARGVDISGDAVAHAQRRYVRPSLSYRQGSCTAMPFEDASADVLVSFETIEHFEDHEAFLREIRRVLRPGGLLVISSPDRETYSPPGKPPNPFHVKELTAGEFKGLIGRNFSNAVYALQKATTGSLLLPAGTVPPSLEHFSRDREGSFVSLDRLDNALYLVAVASDSALPPVRWGVLDDEAYLTQLRDRLGILDGEIGRLERLISALAEQGAARKAETDAARAEALAAREETEAARAQALANAAEAHAARAEADTLRATLAELANSRSWRATRPLREGALLLRSLKRTRSVRNFLWESGKVAADLTLPPQARQAVREAKRKLLGTSWPAPAADLERPDLENPRVTTALKQLLRELAVPGAVGKITHVVAVPFLKRGGGDLTVANIVRVLAEEHGAPSCLVVLADSADLTVREWLPVGVRVVRIDDYVAGPSPQERLDVLHGLVRAIGPAVFHTVNSVVGWNLVIHRGAELSREVRLFGSIFAFQFAEDGELVGYAAEFFERARPHLAGLLTDNARFAKDLAERYQLDDAWQKKVHVVYNPSRALYAPVALPPVARRAGEPLRVLWAGRFDAEKLPDVLQAVSERAGFATFDVFGATTVDARQPPVREHARLRLRGAYQGLDAVLANERYDVFLFTSKWEGMPNVLLEVGAYGLPIVAPDVGGVPELIHDESGWLVRGARNVDGYVEALEAIHRDPAEAAARASRLAELVRERHSWSRFERALRSVPGYV